MPTLHPSSLRARTATSTKPTWGYRFRPRTLLKLMPSARRNPGDIEVGARIFYAVGGHDEGPTFARLTQSETGRRLVETKAPYPPLIEDLARLRTLPAGTLGREYVRELDERGIDPVELAERTNRAHDDVDPTPEHAWVRDRVRHAHDLFHTLTGYGIDLLGEAGVLAFTFGQTGNKGWLSLVVLNVLSCLSRLRFDCAVVAWKGFMRGRRARFLPAVDDWERLLQLPLEAARLELAIPPLEPYRPLAYDEVFGSPAAESV